MMTQKAAAAIIIAAVNDNLKTDFVKAVFTAAK
jgi:hypothetical protein